MDHHFRLKVDHEFQLSAQQSEAFDQGPTGEAIGEEGLQEATRHDDGRTDQDTGARQRGMDRWPIRSEALGLDPGGLEEQGHQEPQLSLIHI